MELWDLYTKDREKVNITMIRGEEQPKGYYRVIVHVCIFNSKGEMLIQQRQPFKKGWSNMWDVSVGGSAISGDTSQMAAEREVKEEIGLDIDLENIIPTLTLHFEKGFDDIYLIEKDIELTDLKLQYEEVQAVKWATKEEIFQMIDDDIFIPYHKCLIDFLFSMRNKKGGRTKPDTTKKTLN